MSISAAVKDAFASAKRPEDGELFEVRDDEGASAVFAQRNWADLDFSVVNYHSSALRLFTPQAFAYYLPAFMLASLADEKSGVADVVIENLTPPKGDADRPSFKRRWLRLSTGQRRAAIEFLRHFEHRNPMAIRSAVSSLESHAG